MPIEVGFDLITRLDRAIRSKNTQEILSLYLNYYPPATQQHFTENNWPKTHEIEGRMGVMQPAKSKATSAPKCRMCTTSCASERPCSGNPPTLKPSSKQQRTPGIPTRPF